MDKQIGERKNSVDLARVHSIVDQTEALFYLELSVVDKKGVGKLLHEAIPSFMQQLSGSVSKKTRLGSRFSHYVPHASSSLPNSPVFSTGSKTSPMGPRRAKKANRTGKKGKTAKKNNSKDRKRKCVIQ